MTAQEYWTQITSDRTMLRVVWRIKYRTYRKLLRWEERHSGRGF